jgi:hypothetical protein
VSLVALECGQFSSGDCAERANCVGALQDAPSDWIGGDDGQDGDDGGPDEGFDVAVDVGSTLESAPESGPDVVAGDGPVDGAAASGGGDADATAGVADSGSFDVVAPEAGDGPASDAADGAADAGSLGPCVTSLPADGQLLFSFDGPDSGTDWYAVSSVDASPPPAALAWTGADGHSCPGALALTIDFAAYTSAVPDMEFDFGAASWSATRLHMWVKVRVAAADAGAYAALNAVSPFVQSDNWADYTFMWLDVPSTFGNGAWNEVVLDLVAPDGGQVNRFGPDVDLASVQRLGVSLADLTTRADGGPAAPSPTVLLLDDVWLE